MNTPELLRKLANDLAAVDPYLISVQLLISSAEEEGENIKITTNVFSQTHKDLCENDTFLIRRAALNMALSELDAIHTRRNKGRQPYKGRQP